MKKILIPFALLVVIFFFGCCECDEKNTNDQVNMVANALLPRDVILKYNLHTERQTGGQDWDGGLDVKELIHKIFDDVLAGKIVSFDPDYLPQQFKELKPVEVEQRMGMSTDTVIVQDPNTGELVEKIEKNEYNTDELKILHFTEKWNFNKENFSLNKEVVELDVVREFQRLIGENEYRSEMSKVCALHFDNPETTINSGDVKNKVLLAENIRYEVDLRTYESWIEGLNQEVFLELIMEKVREDAIEIYDFNENTIKYTYQDIVNQNDFLTDTIVVLVDANTMETAQRIIQYEFDTDMIGSYIFIEDWYYDPDTYKIIKTVKGVAPVLHYYNEADEEMTDLMKKILFQVWFNYEK